MSKTIEIQVAGASVQPTEKFSPYWEILAKMKQQHKAVIEDPAQFSDDDLREPLKLFAKFRTGVEGERKIIISEIVKVQKEVNAIADRLKTEAEKCELILKVQLEENERARREEAEREERARLKRFKERTDRLFSAGFTFDGMSYSVGTVFVNAESLNEMEDAMLDGLIEAGFKEAEQLRKLMEAARKLQEEQAKGREERTGDPAKVDFMGTVGFGITSNLNEIVIQPDKAGWNDDTGEGYKEPLVRNLPFDDDDLPFGNLTPPSAGAVNDEADDPANYRPAGYSLGFEACRAMVIALLNDDSIKKKSQLIQKVKELAM